LEDEAHAISRLARRPSGCGEHEALPSHSKMKFAINSHLPGMTLEEEAPLLQKNGYTGWEVALPVMQMRRDGSSVEPVRQEARRLAALGADHGIETVAVGVGLTPRHITADIGYVRTVFELVREAGSTGVRMTGVHYNDPPPSARALENLDDVAASYHQEAPDFHRLFAEQQSLLGRMAKEAGIYGVQLLMEIHPYYIHNSPSAMLRLIEHCPPSCVGVLLDPQGLAMQGHEGSRQSIDVLRHYLAHVHVKDSFLAKVENGKRRHVQVALWEGTTQWPLLVAALKWAHFDGYWFDEDFRGVGLEERLKTRQYLEKLWAEAPDEPSPSFCLQSFKEHFA
jgi:sugar phosphate isomerase/epimerase